MSTNVTAENGAGITVGQLGVTVVHPEGTASIWARLSPEQRRALAAALDPGRTAGGQWTREDGDGIWTAIRRGLVTKAGAATPEGLDRFASVAADAVVAHLSAHQPKPVVQMPKSVPVTEGPRTVAMALAMTGSALGRVERERDAAVARAEHAEQLIPAYAMLDIWVALGRDSIHFDDWYDEHGYAEAWAELTAAVREARTAPAVTRDDVEKALDTGIRGTTDGCLIDQDTSIPSGECVRLAVDAVCDLLGIEAEQAADPVEAKAAELYRAYHGPSPAVPWSNLNGVGREKFTRLAAHVLGQEAGDE